MADEEYERSVDSLAADLTMDLDEGIRAVHVAIKNRVEPKFKDLEKLGKNAGMKATIIYKYKTEALVTKRSEWKVARRAIFDKFWSHCGAKMKTKLSDAEGWTELEAGRDGIKLIKLIDQLIRFRANNAEEQKQVARAATEEEAERRRLHFPPRA